ncbi:MAG: BatA and WFA domain-containing protein [Puniceicoccales bacterium]|jgi:hypothetical protein|nr:BatA and WFA domain-containing protein [Puniceicoccales bacterium]
MTLLFQNSALIWLLGLAVLPLLAHLIAPARPPVYRFSNVEFLQRVLRLTSRVRRPKDWLLLLLRTFGVIALLMAFLLPVLFSNNAALPGEKHTTVFIIDRSASMAAREDAGIRFENACVSAARYLETARPDLANVIWMNAEPEAVFPEPGPNIGFLAEELQRAEPLPEVGAINAAFDLAMRQLAKAPGHRELVIISDFQANAWRNFTPRIPGDIHVVTQPVARLSPPNLAIVSLTSQPVQPVAGQRLTVLAKVKNFSDEPRRTTLTLDAGGARQSQPMEVPAWGEMEAAFTVHVAASGLLPVNASIEPDAFPWDDQRSLALQVSESLKLAVIAPPASPEAQVLQRLAHALPWLEITVDAVPQSSVKADYWFFPQWRGDFTTEIASLAAEGRTVFLQPGLGVSLKSLSDATNGKCFAGGDANLLSVEKKADGWTAEPLANAPPFMLFAGGEFGNPLAGRFKERVNISQAPSVRSLAQYADGGIALAELPAGSASLILFNLPLDASKTDWTSQGVFLPAMAELLLHSRTATVNDGNGQQAGTHLLWTPDIGQIGNVSMIGPDEKNVPVEIATGSDGSVWRSRQRARPGLYRWLLSGQEVHLTAVDFPETESDLRPLEAPPLFGKTVESAAALVREAELGRGIPVWPWFAAVALVMFLLEGLLSAWNPSVKGGRQ